MADEEATQAPQQDVKPEIKQDVQHLTLTVVHQVSFYDDEPLQDGAPQLPVPRAELCSTLHWLMITMVPAALQCVMCTLAEVCWTYAHLSLGALVIQMLDLLQDGSRVPFRVKKTTLFDKLFKAYCQKKSLDQNTLVFMGSDGQRLNAHQTPAEVIACCQAPSRTHSACSWQCKLICS